jgi:hypothetical protein
LVYSVTVEVSGFEGALDAHGGVHEADILLAKIKVRVNSDFILDASDALFGLEVFFIVAGVVAASARLAEGCVFAQLSSVSNLQALKALDR